MKTYAIGDIHGAYKALVQCFQRSKFDYSKDRLIVMGDVVDGYPLSNSIEQAATEIITFDASIQNPDRRVSKPNMFIKGDEILIFDHELAFSFLELIGKIDDPWEQSAFSSCVRGHFFYRQLKGKSLALERFAQRIKSMDDNFLRSLRSAVPGEWNDDKIDDILNHLSKIVKNADKFIESVRREII